MRPIRLKMEGFGSYLSKTEIDFTCFDENALFLITGSTGGGKTTILDAISFALYGKATGGIRSWEQMRSIGADDDVVTSVDFTFSLGSRIYRFARSQKIQIGKRDKKRKTITENACYELGKTDKLIAAGADRNVSSAAQELLGLDCNQFSRVMVLPQGEFRKLLLSSSEDKAKLFEKLFGTELWTKITEKANKMSDDAHRLAQELDASRRAVLASHECENVEQLEERAVRCKKEYTDAREAADKLDKLLKQRTQELDALKRREKFSAEVKESEVRLASAKKSLALAEADFNRAKVEYEKIPEIKKQTDELKIKIERLEEVGRNIAECKRAERDLKICNEKIAEARQAGDNLRLKLAETEERMKKGNEYLDECRRSEDRIQAERIKLKSLNEIDRNYKRLGTLSNEVKQRESSCAAAARAHADLSLELESLRETEQGIDAKIRGNAAVMLSSSLRDGEPCPVCGSLSHPSPAAHSADGERDLSKKLGDVRRRIKAKENDCAAALAKRSEAEASLGAARSAFEEQQKLCDSYNIYYKTFQKDIDRQNALLKALEDSAAKIPAAEKRLKELTATLDNTKTELERSGGYILELEKGKAQLEERISSLSKNTSGFEKSEEELKKCRELCAALESRAEKISMEQNAAKSALESGRTLVAERSGKLSELSGELAALNDICAGFEIKDTETALNICNELEAKQRQALGAIGELKNESERIERALAVIRQQQGQFEEAERRYSSLSRISNILRGSNHMKTPIRMFVLGMMLDDILMQSNRYFSILSSGRYALKKSVENSGGNAYKGLDIEVFDGAYGGKRPIATLSGGEMFLASLSLAFGLSDVVQGYSGGIRLDSIFIDEGFGSLDSETIDTAMKALDKIKEMGRTVGIISHVAQLREKIGNKIVVTTGAKGSSAKVVSA